MDDSYGRSLDTHNYYRKKKLKSVESMLSFASLILKECALPGRPCTPVLGVPAPEFIVTNGLLGLGGEVGRGAGVGGHQLEQRQAVKFPQKHGRSEGRPCTPPLGFPPECKGVNAGLGEGKIGAALDGGPGE